MLCCTHVVALCMLACAGAGPSSPGDLYGKFTWRIEKFSEISKRELRSTVFEVGGYKWYVVFHATPCVRTHVLSSSSHRYILVYPQGCDVCNHLSLFLCVADYDKLLPGTFAVVEDALDVFFPPSSSSRLEPLCTVYHCSGEQRPQKVQILWYSIYSTCHVDTLTVPADTLHRFCKKEHDWGWKKFMELSKILEGFTVQDTLVIKAQVQVIRYHPAGCLSALLLLFLLVQLLSHHHAVPHTAANASYQGSTWPPIPLPRRPVPTRTGARLPDQRGEHLQALFGRAA